MYQLLVSYDCGVRYRPDREAETIEELEPRMRQLDEQGLRWGLEQDGIPVYDRVCAMHLHLLATVAALRGEVT